MNLFIDTISNPAHLFIFNNSREIIDSYQWKAVWNESSTLIPKIDDFLQKNEVSYNHLNHIVIINWPGSFTWVRTAVLAVNTMNYIIKKELTALSFFDLYTSYPIVKSSSKRDCFLQKSSTSIIEIISNDDLNMYLKEDNISKVYWEVNIDILGECELLDKIDYLSIMREINFDTKQMIDPLYIKKPNIS